MGVRSRPLAVSAIVAVLLSATGAGTAAATEWESEPIDPVVESDAALNETTPESDDDTEETGDVEAADEAEESAAAPDGGCRLDSGCS